MSVKYVRDTFVNCEIFVRVSNLRVSFFPAETSLLTTCRCPVHFLRAATADFRVQHHESTKSLDGIN